MPRKLFEIKVTGQYNFTKKVWAETEEEARSEGQPEELCIHCSGYSSHDEFEMYLDPPENTECHEIEPDDTEGDWDSD